MRGKGEKIASQKEIRTVIAASARERAREKFRKRLVTAREKCFIHINRLSSMKYTQIKYCYIFLLYLYCILL